MCTECRSAAEALNATPKGGSQLDEGIQLAKKLRRDILEYVIGYPMSSYIVSRHRLLDKWKVLGKCLIVSVLQRSKPDHPQQTDP